jgi:hypothetical protein
MPYVAGMFYPDDESSCRREMDVYLDAAQPLDLPDPVRGGLVPHAGWTYSGATAARVYAALAEGDDPETVVILGAAHQWGMAAAAVYAAGAWRTPLGDAPVDEELARALLQAAGERVVDYPQAHATEHSIEVQIPFLLHLFPEVKILPIIVPPRPDAVQLGETLVEAAQSLGRNMVAIASSDLTHYGPRYRFTPAGTGQQALVWARQNDERLLDLVVAMRAQEVLDEVIAHQNACGAGAIAATLACAGGLGARHGLLLHHTSSYEIMPVGRPKDMVGYAAAVLV